MVWFCVGAVVLRRRRCGSKGTAAGLLHRTLLTAGCTLILNTTTASLADRRQLRTDNGGGDGGGVDVY